MGFAKQLKKQKEIKTAGMIRTTPISQAEADEVAAQEKARINKLMNTQNTLWGPGTAFDTQADYQRACLGSKYNH